MAINTVQDIKTLFENLSITMEPFRQDQTRNLNYTKGIQYTAADLKYLHDQQRPPIAWNIVMPKILAWSGLERFSRVSTRVEAVEPSDAKLAEVVNLLMEQDNEVAGTAYEIGAAALNAAIFRYGALALWWDRTLTYPQGKFNVKSLDPRDVWFDMNPSESDFDKSAYLVYSRWYHPEYLIDTFAEEGMQKELRERAASILGVKELKSGFIERYRSNARVSVEGDKNQSSLHRLNNRFIGSAFNDYYNDSMFRVIEVHERRTRKYSFIVNPLTGDRTQIEDNKVKDKEYIRQLLKSRGIVDSYGEPDFRFIDSFDGDDMWLTIVAPHLSDEVLYEQRYPVQGCGFAIKILPCYNLDPDRIGLRAIVDVLIDPQDLINRDLSSRAFMMNKILNPDIYVLAGSLFDEDRDMAILNSQKPGRVVTVTNPDGIKYEYPNVSGINLFTQTAQQAMSLAEMTPGINAALQGRVEYSAESGTLFEQKKEMSEAMLRLLTENVSRTIEQAERYHLGLLKAHSTISQMIRTVNGNGDVEYLGKNEFDAELMRFKWDISATEFDIRPDPQKKSRTEAEREVAQLTQMYMQSGDPQMQAEIITAIAGLIKSPHWQGLRESMEVKRQFLRWQMQVQMVQTQIALAQSLGQQQLVPQTIELQGQQVELQKLQTFIQTLQSQGILQQLTNPQLPMTSQPNQLTNGQESLPSNQLEGVNNV